MKGCEKRVLRRERQDSFFRHGAVDVIVLKNDIFLEDLDGVDFIGPAQLAEHDLPEGTLP